MPVASDPAVVVRTFLDRLSSGDGKGAATLLDPEVEWRNTGLPTLRGRRATRLVAGTGSGAVGVDLRIHHLAADGPIVLTDRTDVIRVGPVATAFWVCGTFEVRDGRIVLWDDHFAAGNFLTGVGKGVVGALRGAVGR